jgi:hypothetical protein
MELTLSLSLTLTLTVGTFHNIIRSEDAHAISSIRSCVDLGKPGYNLIYSHYSKRCTYYETEPLNVICKTTWSCSDKHNGLRANKVDDAKICVKNVHNSVTSSKVDKATQCMKKE